jgi:hypothetical protein
MDDFYLKEIDETSPNIKSTISMSVLSLLDGTTLENNIAFSKLYVINSANTTVNSTDSNVNDPSSRRFGTANTARLPSSASMRSSSSRMVDRSC